MITNAHRKIADIAKEALSLSDMRRAQFLHLLEKRCPDLSLFPKSIERVDGKRLRTIRKRKHWSQKKLARCAGISLRQLVNIENDHTGTTKKRIQLLADALEVPRTEIVKF